MSPLAWTVCALVAAVPGGERPRAVLEGRILDGAGAPVGGAQVTLRLVGTARHATSGPGGEFAFDDVGATRARVRVEAHGFAPAERRVRLEPGLRSRVTITLLPGLRDEVTVTARPGVPRPVGDVIELATVAARHELDRRAGNVLPLLMREEPGVHVQQTSTSQGSLFVRGLTGQQVVLLVDGVRFNTATFRPGANQYLAYLDPESVQTVDLVHGPGSSVFGSDALGGALNVLTVRPAVAVGPSGLAGRVTAAAGSADISTGVAARIHGRWSRWALDGGASARRVGDLRAGQGLDSRSVATRLLGLSSRLLGDRLRDTGYRQYALDLGVLTRLGAEQELLARYQRGRQVGASRYDQLDGGLGNLLHRFDPQALDLALVRYTRRSSGPWRDVSATASYNAQQDDRTFQNVNNTRLGLRSPIVEEQNQSRVLGFQLRASGEAGARHSFALGLDAYDEGERARRRELSWSPATSGFTTAVEVRPRFPDGARYRSLAAYARDEVRLADGRVNAMAGLRVSQFRFSQPPSTGVPLFETSLGDITWELGASWAIRPGLRLTSRAGRAFRAPNVNDFAGIGVSGLGFEVSPDEARSLKGATARGGIVSPVGSLDAETARSYELGLRFSSPRARAAVAGYQSTINGSIERRTLLLPQGTVGRLVGGQPVLRQDVSGAVFTPLSATPVFVRVNGSAARFRGVEAWVETSLPGRLRFSANAAAVHAAERGSGRPPNVENGVPPASGFASLALEPRGRRAAWAEVYGLFARPQRRLSDNDLQQARIGGMRTRDEIMAYFANGAVARGLVTNGVLVATGETVEEVVRRVLGDPSARVPLFTRHPGFRTLNLRAGFSPTTRTSVTLVLENLTDASYRTMGSGVDGPGRSATLRVGIGFGRR